MANETMKISQNGRNLIKEFEGLRLAAYTDSVGVWTIGYGHTKGVYSGMTITEAQANAYLDEDIKSHAYGIYNYVTAQLNQNQFDALVSFHFNLGPYILQGSTLLSYLNNKNWTMAATEMKKYKYAGGVILAGLERRRNAEADLFLKTTLTGFKPTVGQVVRLSGGAKVTTSWSLNESIDPKYVSQYYMVEQVSPLSTPKWSSVYQVLIYSNSNDFRKWVYDQDLSNPGGTKFIINNRVHLSRSATLTSRYSSRKPFDPKYLADNFSVVDIAVTAEDKSPWQYRLKHKSLGDIWVLEQDLQVASKFDKNEVVQMQSFALNAGSWSSNQPIGKHYFSKPLTIIDIARIPQSNSDYQYRIRLNANGVGDLWVLEQDLKK